MLPQGQQPFSSKIINDIWARRAHIANIICKISCNVGPSGPTKRAAGPLKITRNPFRNRNSFSNEFLKTYSEGPSGPDYMHIYLGPQAQIMVTYIGPQAQLKGPQARNVKGPWALHKSKYLLFKSKYICDAEAIIGPFGPI